MVGSCHRDEPHQLDLSIGDLRLHKQPGRRLMKKTTRARAMIGALVVTGALAGCASETDDESPDDTQTETDTGEDSDDDG